MVFIAAHVLLITLLQTLFDFLIWKEFSLQSLFDNIFCGISNIYFHNQINQYANRKKSNQKSVNGLQLAQQLVIESIIILENVVILVLVILDETLQNNTLVIGLVIGNFMLYLLGLALKMGYYKFFYIWNDVLWTDLKTLKADLVKVMRNKWIDFSNPKKGGMKMKDFHIPPKKGFSESSFQYLGFSVGNGKKSLENALTVSIGFHCLFVNFFAYDFLYA